MTGKTHQALGLFSGTASFLLLTDPHYNPTTFAWVVVISSIAALLPDIDQPTSTLWNKIPFGKLAGEFANSILSHRNFTHSLLGYALFSWIFYIFLSHLPSYWGISEHLVLIAFMVAYASHLLADMVTVMGIPLFFPHQGMYGIPPHPFAGIRIITGGWFENLIVFPITNAAIITLIIVEWSLIQIILFK